MVAESLPCDLSEAGESKKKLEKRKTVGFWLHSYCRVRIWVLLTRVVGDLWPLKLVTGLAWQDCKTSLDHWLKLARCLCAYEDTCLVCMNVLFAAIFSNGWFNLIWAPPSALVSSRSRSLWQSWIDCSLRASCLSLQLRWHWPSQNVAEANVRTWLERWEDFSLSVSDAGSLRSFSL